LLHFIFKKRQPKENESDKVTSLPVIIDKEKPVDEKESNVTISEECLYCPVRKHS
jgi:hypothetical protein